MSAAAWTRICALEDIDPDSGACALIAGEQVALFRLRDAVHAIGNLDPASGVQVLARGIVGDAGGEPVVASPMYKQHFSLIDGRCLEEPQWSVPVHEARVVDGQVLVRVAVCAARRAGRRRLVVIGTGPAAMRTLEELLELAPQAYEICVFGAEPQIPYNRVLLSSLLSGEKPLEQLFTHPREWFTRHGITLHAGDPIVHIDRRARRVLSQSGVECAYDRLLIATGSSPLALEVPGQDRPGVICYRDLADVEAMLCAARSERHAIVIGGGILGLEAADGLARRGMAVTVVHLTDSLMERQLDSPAAGLLRAQLEARGLSFLLSARTIEILGPAGSEPGAAGAGGAAGEQAARAAAGVRLADGRLLAADLVVIAIGVRPNIALAQAAGLRCERGILVDDTLQSFDPAIYAVGECVQHRGSTFGLLAPLWEQARVCAAHLAERGVRRYRGSQPAAQLKIEGIELFAAGDCAAQPGEESLVLRDPTRGIYKRLVLRDGCVRGALLVGDARDGGWYAELINQGRSVEALRDQLIFGAPGEDSDGAGAASPAIAV
jgi:NAD(P)H-dependent nitrite reductase small subunit